MSSPELAAALTAFRAGRVDEALALTNRAIAAAPKDPERHNQRGVLLALTRRPEEALASFEAALRFNPDYVEALNNRGNILQSLGRHTEAVASYDAALRLRPAYPEALNNRGASLQALERYADALASHDAALALAPNYVDALNNRGVALQALNRPQEALAIHDRAVALQPNAPKLLNNRGTALRALDRPEDALADFDRALAIAPTYVEAHYNRGNALHLLGRNIEAIASYDKALALRDNYPEAQTHRGLALSALNRDTEALACHDRALALRPAYPQALTYRALTLDRLGRHEEAIADCERALALRPDYAPAIYNRGIALYHLSRYEEAALDFERAYSLEPSLTEALGLAFYSKLYCADWQNFGALKAAVTEGARAGRRICPPFAFLNISDSPAEQLRSAEPYARAPGVVPLPPRPKAPHERLRIAYLSTGFHDHPVAHAMAEFFERRDRRRFETVAISYGPNRPGEMRRRLEATFDHFTDVRDAPDEVVAKLLREREIDIAVDLAGFLAEGRPHILAFRPAPIQVSFVGYPATMGADYIDYAIADRVVIPDAERPFYREKIIHLPHCYLPHDSRRKVAATMPTRSEQGLPERGIVFCSFNASPKINPDIFDIWMRLLRRVDGSVLWLFAANTAAIRNLRHEAQARGVSPERLVFAAWASMEEHMARQPLGDIFLDTLPYNAHSTATNALWSGLPVLTATGTTFVGRVATSLLRAAGMPELAVADLAAYEELAYMLATEPAKLAAVKAKLAQNRHSAPLFDAAQHCRDVETAYTTMWQRYERGEPPDHFQVPAG